MNAETPQKPLLQAVIELVHKLDFDLTGQHWQDAEYQQLRELEPVVYQTQKTAIAAEIVAWQQLALRQ